MGRVSSNTGGMQLTEVVQSLQTLQAAHNTQVQAGGSASDLPGQGNLNVQVSSAGVQPAGTAAFDVLAVFSIPAGFFSAAGKGLTISAQGDFAATVNTKQVQIVIGAANPTVGQVVSGGTVIADTGAVTTNGGGWAMAANVFKTGAAGSNTQLSLHQQSQVGGAVAALLASQALTLTESGAIPVAVVGKATTATTDITFRFLEVNATN